MKIAKKASSDIQEGDFTAMIDMVFQLICFFMVVINFSEADQNEEVTLPLSEIVREAQGKMEHPITMHLTKEDKVVIGGEKMGISQIQTYLAGEKTDLSLKGKKPGDATIIIRADLSTKTGKVQELIKECQKSGFDRFALRAKEEVK